MSRYDEIDPEQVKRQLVRVAKLILRLEAHGELLREAPRLQKLLGDLRQRLFAYEVRCAADLGRFEEAPDEDGGAAQDPDDPLLRESMRVVREALERQEELRGELNAGEPGADDDERRD